MSFGGTPRFEPSPRARPAARTPSSARHTALDDDLVLSLDHELETLADDRMVLTARAEAAEQQLQLLQGQRDAEDGLWNAEKPRLEAALVEMTAAAEASKNQARELESARYVLAAEKEALTTQLAETRRELGELRRQHHEDGSARTHLSSQLAETLAEKRGLEALCEQTESRWRHWFKTGFQAQLKESREERQLLRGRAEAAEAKCAALGEAREGKSAELAFAKEELANVKVRRRWRPSWR